MPDTPTLLDIAATTTASARALARSAPSSGELYPLIGELRATLRMLGEFTEQLGKAHLHHLDRARDETADARLGGGLASLAAETLDEAASLLSEIETDLDIASVASGRIVWAPTPSQQWLSVLFLQGGEADVVLDLIDKSGVEAGIEHLMQWDFGDETTDAALVNGYVYDSVPAGVADRVAESDNGDYALCYSVTHGYVSLLRRRSEALDVEPNREDPPPAHVDSSRWFGGLPAATSRDARGRAR